MRPWTLDTEDVSTLNPLLTGLQKPDAPATPETKRKRIKEKATDEDGAQPDNQKLRESYALAIEESPEKGAVSAMASRYITNLFACTAARAVGEERESEDEHSDEEGVQNKEGHAGSLVL